MKGKQDISCKLFSLENWRAMTGWVGLLGINNTAMSAA